MKHFYANAKENIWSTIAYKGGHFEKDLLCQLQIPSINLKFYEYPKAEFLFDKLVWLETCGQHVETQGYKHYLKAEVEAFAEWLKERRI